MSRCAALGRHGFCKTAKIGRRSSKARRRYERSKPLPPRQEAVADQNLNCPGHREPADAKPPSKLGFTVDASAWGPRRNVFSKPIEQLTVERPVNTGIKRSFGGHAHPVIRLTGQSAVENRNVKSATILPRRSPTQSGLDPSLLQRRPEACSQSSAQRCIMPLPPRQAASDRAASDQYSGLSSRPAPDQDIEPAQAPSSSSGITTSHRRHSATDSGR
jgi:hypothetical protein